MRKLTVKKIKKLHVLLSFGVIIVISGVFIIYSATAVDCKSIADKAHKLMGKQDYKQAYALLDPHINSCLSSLEKTSASHERTKHKIIKNTQELVVIHDVAKSAYIAGHQDKALAYAEQGLNISKAMSTSDRVKLAGYDSIIFTLLSISIGFYQPPIGTQQ